MEAVYCFVALLTKIRPSLLPTLLEKAMLMMEERDLEEYSLFIRRSEDGVDLSATVFNAVVLRLCALLDLYDDAEREKGHPPLCRMYPPAGLRRRPELARDSFRRLLSFFMGSLVFSQDLLYDRETEVKLNCTL